ncbi:sigma-70 family RNA polymerase sigma factor [Methylophaga muralis]|uniref:Putative RNA polymerase sigma factor FecI n=1 Tax=Methylophaga muralis TaxID=291169 RepID=A0A1E3GR97_9GAMM|nr:sigma-70 family RNA polymerase sigma factor [Methylophaga muralis]ODN66106.1 putative RNA polymerase sigma factor FecI [Methylophaga muralis]
MAVIGSSLTEQVEQLYKEHRSWLSIFIQRRTGCPQVTADLIHDTYLKILTSGRLPKKQDSKRFLTHIAKGLLIDNYRRKQIEEAYQDYLLQLPQDHAPSAETHVQMIEALTEIDALLHRLPDNVREALLLRQLDNLSYKEIAKRMNVSVSSVEKYIAKGLQACIEAAIEDRI